MPNKKEVSIWNNPDFRSLTLAKKLFVIMLLSYFYEKGKLFTLGKNRIAKSTGLSDIESGFMLKDIVAAGYISIDEDSDTVVITVEEKLLNLNGDEKSYSAKSI